MLFVQRRNTRHLSPCPATMVRLVETWSLQAVGLGGVRLFLSAKQGDDDFALPAGASHLTCCGMSAAEHHSLTSSKSPETRFGPPVTIT